MTIPHRSTLSRLLIGACCAASLLFPPAADAQRPTRLYGVIDIDRVGSDIGFSIDLAPPHTLRFYAWGRHLDEIEGMAVAGAGELYLFYESGDVKKLRLGALDDPPVSVAPGGGFEFSAASSRSDGTIEAFDVKGRQLVTLDPRRGRILPGRTRVGPDLKGLAWTATQRFGIANARGGTALHVYNGGQFQRVCARGLDLSREVNAIEWYTGTSLVIARLSITNTNQVLLHVETLEPGTCAVRPLLDPVEIRLDQIRRFFDPSEDLESLLRRARRFGRTPQIEATAIVR